MKDSTINFLIVDDCEPIRFILKSLFDLYDFDSEYATNGQEAVDAWAKGHFKAILMDLDMPIMGGLEAARIIRQREKEEMREYTPIYALSATEMSDPQRVCREAGMDGFLSKPVRVSRILEVIFPLVNSSPVGPVGRNGRKIKHQTQRVDGVSQTSQRMQ